MNESETRAELIDPALKATGWGEVDASLIAAAPDLLETLQELIRRESECEEVLTIFMDAKIRAVIAKAQGVCR